MSGRRARERRRQEGGEAGRARGRQNAGHARRRAKKKKRARAGAFFIFAAATLVGAGYLLKPAIFGRDTPPPDATIIDIAADMGGFDQPVIRVAVGEPVTIRLTSLDNRFHTDGGGKHQFAVDEFDLSIIAQPLKSAMETFTPTEPGTYVFYCDICCGGRANPTMSGKLIVVEA